MRPTKVVLIGAASASFGPSMIADALLTPELQGSTLALVDIDGPRLEVMAAYARRLNDSLGRPLAIEHATERTHALPGAEFVITSIAVERNELWKLDFQIPLKHGIKQVFGENGGPGGLSHSLRNIPIVLDIAQDMERLCPRAMLLNFSNPESRICLAVSRYTGLRFAGLCHGIAMGYDAIGRITGLPGDDLVGTAAGLNHFAWFLDIRRRSTGEDVYPLLQEREPGHRADEWPLTRHLFHTFGLWPHPSDDHIGEYLPYAWEYCGLEGYNFTAADRHRVEAWERLSRIAAGDDPPPAPGEHLRRSGEFAFQIIAAAVAGRTEVVEAVNIRNGGCIAGLPEWAVVEIPAVVDANGLRGIRVGALPAGITALVGAQVHVQDLVVEAAVHGSRQMALQALLADPSVPSAQAAEKTLDELLSVHRQWLPRFAGE